MFARHENTSPRIIAVKKGMIIIFTNSLLATSSQTKCSIMNFNQVLAQLNELRIWEDIHTAWEVLSVLAVVGYWAWPKIRQWITPDPPPPANPVAGDLVDLDV